jgi:small-conductance mechanosensitive channel
MVSLMGILTSVATRLLILLSLLAPVTLVEAAAQKAPAVTAAPAPAPASALPLTPPRSTAIPLAQVATQAADAANLIRTLNVQSIPTAETEVIERQLPEAVRFIELEQTATTRLLEGSPPLEVIASQQQAWRERQLQAAKWLLLLTQRATTLQETMDRLGELQTTWRQTRIAAVTSKAPASLLQQIDETLAAIQAAHAPLQARRGLVLDLQGRVAQALAVCESVLAQILQARQQAVGSLFVRDAPPIWSPELRAAATREALLAEVRVIAADRWETLVQYLRDLASRSPRDLAALLLLIALMMAACRHARRLGAGGDAGSAIAVLGRPFAVAFIIPLFVATAPNSMVPSSVRQLLLVLCLAPVLRVVVPAVDRRMVSSLYTLAGLFALDALRQAFAGSPVLELALLAIEMVMAAAGRFLIARHLRRLATDELEKHRVVFRLATGLVTLALAAALLAGALGYLRLGRLVASGVVGSGALALTFYACARAAAGMTAFALRVWPLRRLRMVEQHRDLLERRTTAILTWGAAVGWAARSLDYVGLLQWVVSVGRAMLTAHLDWGSISLSLGDILWIALTVWVAYLASAFIRFALESDVYPRVHMPRGISYVISSLLHYVLILLGFLLGVAALGVDLTKVSILVGALGVGIGFGLQGVVNNFVSGLVLLFERPIHVNDVVEIGELAGTVRRIGMRASTVESWQGAEIIVPNSQLVSERLTNWTLTDRRRRIDLPVGVGYGSPPGKVIEVLEAAARRQPGVAAVPPPRAFFIGFGDSGINFQLQCWADDFDDWFRLRSELGVALYDAVCGAGMSFSFPQREVRLVDSGPKSLPVAPQAEPSNRGSPPS